MNDYKTALITGASSGIGAAFAEALALDGIDLVLVARSADKLRLQAKQLAEVNGIRAEFVVADLSQPGCGEPLGLEVGKLGMQVDLLVNNAGFGTAGSFHKQDAARERDEVMLNAAAIVDLCHAFLPDMLERGRGGVINVASVAAFQPLPYLAVYAATKAFVLSFTEALRGEYARKGLRIMSLCPGPVDTPFFEATGDANLRGTVPKGTMLGAPEVVASALKAFKAGKGVCVPGYANKLLAASSQLIPRSMLTAMTARVMKR